MTQGIDSLVDPQNVVAPAATQSIGLRGKFNSGSSLKEGEYLHITQDRDVADGKGISQIPGLYRIPHPDDFSFIGRAHVNDSFLMKE